MNPFLLEHDHILIKKMVFLLKDLSKEREAYEFVQDEMFSQV